jgi:glutathione S-transferase
MLSGLNISTKSYDCLDEATVDAVRQKLNYEILPRHLQFFDNFLERSTTGWLLGGEKPTIADFDLAIRIALLVAPGMNDGIDSNLLDNFPRIQALIEKFKTTPEIVAFYTQKK